jgi:hypothetical protein
MDGERVVDLRQAEMMHRCLLCIKNVETEFGIFSAGAHAMLLSLLGKFLSRDKNYELDIKRDLHLFCSITDNIYDWFDEFKRKQAMDAELLRTNHRIGEQVVSIVRKVREGGRKGDEE